MIEVVIRNVYKYMYIQIFTVVHTFSGGGQFWMWWVAMSQVLSGMMMMILQIRYRHHL